MSLCSTMARRLALVVPSELRPTNPMANTISRVRAKSQSVEGCADAFSEVCMCQEMGTAKDLCEHNGTTTGTVGTEAIAFDESEGLYYQPRACEVSER